MTPKVLVISNECFSKTSSNGRTLGNFFVGWPKEALAQFFLSGQPDYDYCENYYQVSDYQALNALFRKKDIGGVVLKTKLKEKEKRSAASEKKTKRNALTMLVRDFIWKISPWKSKGYWKWVKHFNPDIVLMQAGDCAFMYELAVETSKKMESKLIIYNSEGYYFKNFDYFRGHGIAHILYPFFLIGLKKSLRKAYEKAYCVIYICDELKESYEKEFSGYAETVFTGSDVKYADKEKENIFFTTVYCGNLGIKRHESLIDIANVLQSISKDLYVDVYGGTNDIQVIEALNNCKGIRFHGLVPYEEVKGILRNSDLILYVESFDMFYQEDVKFGFSTKIADSLSSGNCFLLYSPEHFACHQYLKNNDAAYTASTRDQLKTILKELVNNPKARVRYQAKALELARKNHDILKNNEKFQSILRDAMK